MNNVATMQLTVVVSRGHMVRAGDIVATWSLTGGYTVVTRPCDAR